MEIKNVSSVQQSQQLQPTTSTQQKGKGQEVQPSTIVTISEEARHALNKPIGNFEDGQGHLSNRAYAQSATDPVYQKIL